MTLRRGFWVKPDERLLVVEDVVTTGGSTRECIAAVEDLGAVVVGAASLIDRSNGAADVSIARTIGGSASAAAASSVGGSWLTERYPALSSPGTRAPARPTGSSGARA